jgi:hypothetical protein
VLGEQGGEAIGRLRPVEGLDRVADVLLVAKQPLERRLQVGQLRREGDDRQPRPGDVVLPELSQPVVKAKRRAAELRVRARARHVLVIARLRAGGVLVRGVLVRRITEGDHREAARGGDRRDERADEEAHPASLVDVHGLLLGFGSGKCLMRLSRWRRSAARRPSSSMALVSRPTASSGSGSGSSPGRPTVRLAR